MKLFIEKGKETNGINVKVINDEGKTIADEKKVKDMIVNFWGDVFCLKGNATYGVKKGLVDCGMKNEVCSINDQDLKEQSSL